MLALLVGSCGGKKSDDEDTNTSEKPADAPIVYKADVANLEKGKQLYATTCTPCHGKEGKGDGPAAPNLNPRPRDHSKAEYMNKLTDDHIGNVIKKGGASFGYPNMPSQPQFKEDEIDALIAFVRTLSQKSSH